jgi:hypothetical protein
MFHVSEYIRTEEMYFIQRQLENSLRPACGFKVNMNYHIGRKL